MQDRRLLIAYLLPRIVDDFTADDGHGDVIRPRKRRLNVNHVHAGVNGRFSHPSVEGHDVSCSPRERQCDV